MLFPCTLRRETSVAWLLRHHLCIQSHLLAWTREQRDSLAPWDLALSTLCGYWWWTADATQDGAQVTGGPKQLSAEHCVRRCSDPSCPPWHHLEFLPLPAPSCCSNSRTHRESPSHKYPLCLECMVPHFWSLLLLCSQFSLSHLLPAPVAIQSRVMVTVFIILHSNLFLLPFLAFMC